jgi:hypothetical protein
MDYCDMTESLRARETAPLPRIPLRDLAHWRDPVPPDLEAKNAAALSAYRERAAVAGEYRDALRHTARVAAGLAARHRVLRAAA